MVLKKSPLDTIGTVAPAFELPDTVSGKTVNIEEYRGAPATIIIFMCNHCPFVVHLLGTLPGEMKNIQDKGAKVLAISSNSTTTHPQDGPEFMAKLAKDKKFTFPYLFDESQSVAKAFRAACTPEFIVLDKDLNIQYHGRFDASTPGNGKQVTGDDLRAAVDEVLNTGSFSGRSIPSMGCSIKWNPGNEPDYF